MKKALLLLAATFVITMSAVCVSASTTLEDYTPVKDKYTVTYDVGDTNAAGMYGMVAIKGTNTIIDTSNLENIFYIDQTSANSDGIITFSEFAPKGVAPSHKDFEPCTVFIGGPGFGTAEAIGVLQRGELGFFISGKVVDTASTKTATITVKNASGEVIATAQAEADGTFSVPVPAGEGYSVVITKANYMSYTFTGVNVSDTAEEPIALPNADMSTSAGDITGNGFVNIDDLTILLDDYDEPTITNQNADITGNGFVNIDDLTILLEAYDEQPIVKPAQ